MLRYQYQFLKEIFTQTSSILFFYQKQNFWYIKLISLLMMLEFFSITFAIFEWKLSTTLGL